MSTPLSWLEGQARGREMGHRTQLRTLTPGCKQHTRVRQRLNYAYKTKRCARTASSHLRDCYDEIARLGGVAPSWPKQGQRG